MGRIYGRGVLLCEGVEEALAGEERVHLIEAFGRRERWGAEMVLRLEDEFRCLRYGLVDGIANVGSHVCS